MATTVLSPALAPAANALDQIRAEIITGLLDRHAQISPKFFYDPLGSKLFEAICQLDEYYLTRCEASIFAAAAAEIAERTGQGTTLIDLGAGNCEKAAGLFETLQPRQYVPIDISVEFLNEAVAVLHARYPDLPISPLGMDLSEGPNLPAQIRRERRLFFYPGSSLGNFTPLQALQFLRRIRHASGADGAVLIGIDLVKDNDVLEAAYDDALGVTAAFNRNILRHVNAVLGADFNLGDWRHLALFNKEQSRIEMHLEASRNVTVHWPGGERSFAAGDRIHTENSYKYTRQRFLDLLDQAGFGKASCWTDDENLFLVCHAQAI